MYMCIIPFVVLSIECLEVVRRSNNCTIFLFLFSSMVVAYQWDPPIPQPWNKLSANRMPQKGEGSTPPSLAPPCSSCDPVSPRYCSYPCHASSFPCWECFLRLSCVFFSFPIPCIIVYRRNTNKHFLPRQILPVLPLVVIRQAPNRINSIIDVYMYME